MNIGQLVSHPKYGFGTVIAIESQATGHESHKAIAHLTIFGATHIWQDNSMTRYKGNLNIAVKFDNGGPQGWAYGATNDIEELVIDGD